MELNYELLQSCKVDFPWQGECRQFFHWFSSWLACLDQMRIQACQRQPQAKLWSYTRNQLKLNILALFLLAISLLATARELSLRS